MSITFNSGGNLGETDVSSNIKGVQKGPGNAVFANFSDLLTSATGEELNPTGEELNPTGEELNSSLKISSKNDQSTRGLGEVDAKLFTKVSADGALAEPVVDGRVDFSTDPVDFRLSMDFPDTPISCPVFPSFLDEPVVDGGEGLLDTPVVDGGEGLLDAAVVNDAEGLLDAPVVDGGEDLLDAAVINGAEDAFFAPGVDSDVGVFVKPVVDSGEDVVVAPVVSDAEALFVVPAVNSAEDLFSKSVVYDAEDLHAVPVVDGVEVSIAAPVVEDARNFFVATDANATKDITLSVGNVISHSNTSSDAFSSNPSIDNVIDKLGVSSPLDSDFYFNTTTAFMGSRIETLGPNVETVESEVGIKFSTFEDLVSALGVFAKQTVADGSKGGLPTQDISEAPNLDFLSDLTDGIAMHLELKDSNSSFLFFDIRDLKKNLNEVFSSTPKDGAIKTPIELLIPQTVPIQLGVSNVIKKDYDPFIPVKLQLIDAEGKLGATDLFNISGDDDLEPGVNLVSVAKIIEIDPDTDTRSRLLIGLSIPKDTDPNRLPDFVKFDIRLENVNRNSADAKTPLLTEVQELARAEIAQKSEVPLDLKIRTKALILALEEMSNASKNGEQIVTKIASTDPILKFSQNLDIRPVSLLEANSFFHKQLLDVKNPNLSKEDASEVSSLNQKPLTLDLLQKQIIVEKNAVLLSTTKIDGWPGPIDSALNLATPNKFLNLIKSDKNYLFSEQTGANGFEKKVDLDAFNPKSFLEAADTLRMKQITFPSSIPQVEQLSGRQADMIGFGINKFDNIVLPNASPSINLEGLAPGVNNKISLYSAQYASRLGMLVVDKVLKGQQNFEIHLEPESFGKIKVNVFLDKQAIDIRMVAETQAAASLLRANEDSLLQITAQNGMKLANFAVGMQSGSEQQRQNSNQNRNRVTDKANNVLKHDAARNSQSQTSYRTSTSLNLIA